jgi:hypothetical protein
MKKQLLTLTLFLIFILQNVSSQNSFPAFSDNPIWNVYGSENVWGGLYTNTLTYEYDTLFCGHEFMKTSGNPTNLTGYLRVEDKKVFVRKSNNCTDKEYLMYDFSLQLNDAVYCGHNILDPYTEIDTTLYWVAGKESKTFFGVERKVLNMKYYVNGPGTPIRTVNWIEGIGSTDHPFFSLVCLIDYCESLYTLLCYDSSGTQLYQHPDFTTCNTNVGIEEQSNILSVIIQPNPFSQHTTIKIEHADSEIIKIQIYSIAGLKLYDFSTNREKTSIQTGHQLDKGIYFIKLMTNKKEIIRKIIKTE